MDVGTRFVELLPGVGHARLVFGAFHSLAQLVNVRQHFLLFFAQTFQSSSNLFALSLGLRLLERGLQFLEPLVQVLLALRQFLQPVQHLELLALLGVLLRRGLPLGFVTIVRLFEFQLVKLSLRALALLAAALLVAAA